MVSHEVSWRNPKSIMDLLAPIYAKESRDYRQGNDRIGKRRIVQISGPAVVIKGHDMYLVFRQDEKISMNIHHRNMIVNTIHERRGDKGKSVCLIRLKHRLEIYDSVPHLIVALSGTESDFTHCTIDPNDKLSEWLKRGELPDFALSNEEVFSPKNYIHLGGLSPFGRRNSFIFEIRRRLIMRKNGW